MGLSRFHSTQRMTRKSRLESPTFPAVRSTFSRGKSPRKNYGRPETFGFRYLWDTLISEALPTMRTKYTFRKRNVGADWSKQLSAGVSSMDNGYILLTHLGLASLWSVWTFVCHGYAHCIQQVMQIPVPNGGRVLGILIIRSLAMSEWLLIQS